MIYRGTAIKLLIRILVLEVTIDREAALVKE